LEKLKAHQMVFEKDALKVLLMAVMMVLGTD